jgi:hypothetical protein
MKMYRVTLALAICVGVVVAAGSASAAVLYANDFNSCAFDSNWSTVWLDPKSIFHTTTNARSGCAVQLHYANTADAMTRGEGAATDRQLYNGGPAGPGCLLVTVGGPNPYLGCQGTAMRPPESFIATPYNYSGGYSTAPAQQRGVWVCYEYEIDLGDLGASNGLMRLWKNDVLIGEVTGQSMRPSTAVGHFNNIAFYQERGIGDIWFDDLVITDGTRIGCSGGAPAGSTTQDQPPGAPRTPSITTVNTLP